MNGSNALSGRFSHFQSLATSEYDRLVEEKGHTHDEAVRCVRRYITTVFNESKWRMSGPFSWSEILQDVLDDIDFPVHDSLKDE